MIYETVIGLEVHAQLLTSTKIFCSCGTSFGAEPNTQICPVCSGMPGVLPVMNKKVLELAIRMALATHCAIRTESVFARKNYFYPDLPKAYQISQYDKPLAEKGYVDIEVNGQTRRIDICRIHMEEDAGKSIHDRGDFTHVDFNRCGTPLIEIVTDPVIHTPEEAYAYLAKIRQIVRYLGVCDGNMEEGSLRCDANISLRPKGETKLGTKTEVKNMNSFRNVERAIKFEIERQRDILESGGKIVQQTLLWDPDAGEARPMRSKEDAHDYRYFPDPDLMVVKAESAWVDSIQESLPELPETRITRFVEKLGLPEYDAQVLTEEREVADFYEAAVGHHSNPKAISNWMMTEILRIAKESKEGIKSIRVTPLGLADLVKMIDSGAISGKIAKAVFEDMNATGKSAEAIVREKGLQQVSDSGQIADVIRQVLQKSPQQVAEFKAGKTKVVGFLVGEVMKMTKGKANPKLVNELMQKELESITV